MSDAFNKINYFIVMHFAKSVGRYEFDHGIGLPESYWKHFPHGTDASRKNAPKMIYWKDRMNG